MAAAARSKIARPDMIAGTDQSRGPWHGADMSFCEHCEGQRFDRARVLRALRQLRKDLRKTDRRKADEALALALKAVKGLDIPHLELIDEGDEIIH